MLQEKINVSFDGYVLFRQAWQELKDKYGSYAVSELSVF